MCCFIGSDAYRIPTPFSELLCQGCVDLPHQQDQGQVHQTAGDIGNIPSLKDKMYAQIKSKMWELLQVVKRLMKWCIILSYLIFKLNTDGWCANLSAQNWTPGFKHHYAHYTAIYNHSDQKDHHYTQLNRDKNGEKFFYRFFYIYYKNVKMKMINKY